MKKFYRYMSLAEMQKLTSGMELIHKGRFHARTDSEGFCFLSEKTKASSLHDENEYVFSPEECYDFLGGIVSSDVLVEFEANDDVSFTESYGIYADPMTDGWDDFIEATEYCIPSYSLDTLKPIRYAMFRGSWNTFDWYPWN